MAVLHSALHLYRQVAFRERSFIKPQPSRDSANSFGEHSARGNVVGELKIDGVGGFETLLVARGEFVSAKGDTKVEQRQGANSHQLQDSPVTLA